VTHKNPSMTLLLRKRAHALRRAETVGRAVDRLEGTKEELAVKNRYREYLQTVANLTLAIDQLRASEGKEVRVLGSLAT
jgi:hypothetical protein